MEVGSLPITKREKGSNASSEARLGGKPFSQWSLALGHSSPMGTSFPRSHGCWSLHEA